MIEVLAKTVAWFYILWFVYCWMHVAYYWLRGSYSREV
jgi:hypothetical protein